MTVEDRYMRIEEAKLQINTAAEKIQVSASVGSDFKIVSEGRVHTLSCEMTFHISIRYYGRRIGFVKGVAGAIVSGVERNSPELSRKAVEIARALHDYVPKAFAKYAQHANYSPELGCDVRDEQLFTTIHVQNDGLGNPGFNHRGKM